MFFSRYDFLVIFFFFFFNDTATTEIYTLSLTRRSSDLFPLSIGSQGSCQIGGNLSTNAGGVNVLRYGMMREDRKSTRLNSSHLVISYAVFCLKKKKKKNYTASTRCRGPV